MKTILCDERKNAVDLDSLLTHAQPLLIGVEPFSGKLQISLRMREPAGFKAICTRLVQGEPSKTIPDFATELKSIPASFCMMTKDQEGFRCFFCLSTKDLAVSLSGSQDGGLQLSVESGSSRSSSLPRNALLCVAGSDLVQTIDFAMRGALAHSGRHGKLSSAKAELPLWMESLGWGSGASFGQDVTHAKVVNAVWSLRQLGFQPGYVLIDEGWQTLAKDRNGPKMEGFEADPDKFPFGLKGLVDELQRAGVRHVGVWHGIMGARGGVGPHLASRYGLPPDEKGRYFLGYDLGRTFQFFHDYYGFLSDQGITFVKVGDQNKTKSYCRPGMSASSLYHNLQTAMQAAACIQLEMPHINSECLQNENIFYWTTSLLASAGECLDMQSGQGWKKALHILLMNSFWLKYLMHADFNSWPTSLRHSPALAMFHAVSGSINVICDPPGKNNAQLLRKLVLPSGRILKASETIAVCDDCLFLDPLEEPHLYKCHSKKGDKGVLAIFNLFSRKKTLKGSYSPKDVRGLTGDLFAVHSHNHGFLGVIERDAAVATQLKHNESDIVILSPVTKGVAVIGAHLFFLPPGPIVETTIEDDSVHIASQVAAPMMLYCEKKILEIRRNGEVVPWEYDAGRCLLTIDLRSSLSEIPSVYTISFE